MFTNKKFLAALLCTPLFGACVVNGDDTGAESGGTDPTTGPSTSSPTTTNTTTTVGTEDTGPSTSMTTVEPTTTEPGDTSVGTTGPDTDTGGDGMACFPTCTEPVDCCTEGDMMCTDGIGTYPYAWSCDGGFCFNDGCSTDEECTFGGALEGWICNDLDGYGLCALGCAEDMDCDTPATTGFLCTGGGMTYCEPPPCVDDADCGKGNTCEDDGTCSFPPCETDDDCGGFGTCDVDAGTCGCATDKDCPKGFGCDAF